MNLIDRAEIWLNCRKIELSAWLKDSSKSHSTSYDASTRRYETVSLFDPNKNAQARAEMVARADAARARHGKLCAMDPTYKARAEKADAALAAEAAANWRGSGLSAAQIEQAKKRIAEM